MAGFQISRFQISRWLMTTRHLESGIGLLSAPRPTCRLESEIGPLPAAFALPAPPRRVAWGDLKLVVETVVAARRPRMAPFSEHWSPGPYTGRSAMEPFDTDPEDDDLELSEEQIRELEEAVEQYGAKRLNIVARVEQLEGAVSAMPAVLPRNGRH